MRARYRNKLKKIIIEVEYKGKWYYVKTLSNPEVLFEQECLKKCLDLQRQESDTSQIKPQEVRIRDINTSFEDGGNKTL